MAAVSTVLIAANPYEAEMLRRAVEEAGYRAAVADGGDGALELLDRERPQAVILAPNLIAVDGLELLDAMRARSGRALPVILIEDDGGPLATPDRARARGADWVLLRPIDPVLLGAKIDLVAGRPPPEPTPVDDDDEERILSPDELGAVIVVEGERDEDSLPGVRLPPRPTEPEAPRPPPRHVITVPRVPELAAAANRTTAPRESASPRERITAPMPSEPLMPSQPPVYDRTTAPIEVADPARQTEPMPTVVTAAPEMPIAVTAAPEKPRPTVPSPAPPIELGRGTMIMPAVVDLDRSTAMMAVVLDPDRTTALMGQPLDLGPPDTRSTDEMPFGTRATDPMPAHATDPMGPLATLATESMPIARATDAMPTVAPPRITDPMPIVIDSRPADAPAELARATEVMAVAFDAEASAPAPRRTDQMPTTTPDGRGRRTDVMNTVATGGSARRTDVMNTVVPGARELRADGMTTDAGGDGTSPGARRITSPLLRADDAIDFARTLPDVPSRPPPAQERLTADTVPGIDQELGLPAPARPATLTGPPAASPWRGPEQTPLGDAGELGDVALPELIGRLHRAGFSGRLTLRRGDGERAILFEAGYPVFASSNLPHDRLADLLWREGRLTREQWSRALAATSAGGEALVALGLLRRDELFPALRRHIEELIYACFGWERGGWSLGGPPAAADERVRIDLHPYAIAAEGIRRKYGLERLIERVGDAAARVSPTVLLPRVAELAQLTPGERAAALELADGPHSVAELASLAGLDDVAAYAVVHLLLALGAAQRHDGSSSLRPDPAPLAPGSTVDRQRALAKHAQVLDGDYFAVLGVPRDATSYEVRRAWERLRAEFSIDRLDAAERDDLFGPLGEIAEVVDEAYRLLADDAVRAAYRARLDG